MSSHWTNRTVVNCATTLLLATGLLVACDRENDPMAPASSLSAGILDLFNEVTAEEQDILDDATVELSRLGDGGQAVVGSVELTGNRRITVAAFRDPDGTYWGRFIFLSQLQAGAQVLRGDVVCLSIVGNTAHVFGTADVEPSVTGLLTVGHVLVTDNGHSSDPLPDQANFIRGETLPQNVNPTQCTFPLGGLEPAMRGNITVRP